MNTKYDTLGTYPLKQEGTFTDCCTGETMDILDVPLDTFLAPCSTRVYNALRGGNLRNLDESLGEGPYTVRHLLRFRKEELLRLPLFGATSVKEVQYVLRGFGLTLKESTDKYRVSADGTTVVDPHYFWRELLWAPRGLRVLLLTTQGVTIDGQYNGQKDIVAWCPKPTIHQRIKELME